MVLPGDKDVVAGPGESVVFYRGAKIVEVADDIFEEIGLGAFGPGLSAVWAADSALIRSPGQEGGNVEIRPQGTKIWRIR